MFKNGKLARENRGGKESLGHSVRKIDKTCIERLVLRITAYQIPLYEICFFFFNEIGLPHAYIILLLRRRQPPTHSSLIISLHRIALTDKEGSESPIIDTAYDTIISI